jgi:Rps23 Pro-64 3,4-dihydroxylase Tpa1-like proline 4-hydroxylase
MLNRLDHDSLRNKFLSAEPFHHVVIDNFFTQEVASAIANSFYDHNDSAWTVSYDNFVEKKKACSHWDKFPAPIYSAMFYLCSQQFSHILSRITSNDLIVADYGLHGGGMHSHSRAGKLNIHKDYSIHPKLSLMRNYNLIVYMTPNWNPSWGGGLEFWSNDSENNQPLECVTTIQNLFNRAVIFDTTQNSWHGLPEELTCPENVSRNSLATYYLSEITSKAEPRKRALYAPYGDQKSNPEVLEFCKKRSGL